MSLSPASPAGRVQVPRWLPKPTNASAVYLLAIEFLVFGLWIPGIYFTSATFQLVFSGQVVAGMVALAVLIPFTAGAFDLSAGSMAAFSLVIIAALEQHTHLNIVLGIVIGLVACAFVGLLSGIVTVFFRVNSFIATLGMSQVLTAAALLISNNQQIVGVFGQHFLNAGQGNWLGIPRVLYSLVAVGLVMWYVLDWTPLGRRMFATGSNVQSTRLAGIGTNSIIIGSLVASAVVAGLAGVIFGAQSGSYSISFGAPLLFPALASLFFGATQFKNRPNVWGTFVAVFALAFGVQGLQLGFSGGVYWLPTFFNGMALLIAVAFAARAGRLPFRRRPARTGGGDQTANGTQGQGRTHPGDASAVEQTSA